MTMVINVVLLCIMIVISIRERSLCVLNVNVKKLASLLLVIYLATGGIHLRFVRELFHFFCSVK